MSTTRSATSTERNRDEHEKRIDRPRRRARNGRPFGAGRDVTVKLMDKVRKGGSGVYGPIPMSPNGPDKIADADLGEAVAWILQQ